MINLNNVDFKFQEYVLKNINFTFEENEIICIIGQNGAGKSTLLNLIAGLIKPTNGEIFIDNLNTKNKKKELQIRKKLTMVFQNPDTQILFPNVYEDIEFAMKNLRLKDRENKIEQALKMVNMLEFRNKNSFELSLGQKQRINIAGAIAVEPKYLLLDEATTMIDSNEKEVIYKIIKRLKNNGTTIIMVTNNIEEILLADKIVILENGNIKNSFYKNDILQNIEQLEKCNINIPSIVKMLKELKKHDIQIDMEEWTIDELIKKIILYIENIKSYKKEV